MKKQTKKNDLQYQVNTSLITKKMGQKITVFDAQRSILHTLNQTAGIIFTGVQLKWSEEKIIKKIASQYNASEIEIAKDVKESLKDLAKKKIIIESPVN